jgi:hypothetical protein
MFPDMWTVANSAGHVYSNSNRIQNRRCNRMRPRDIIYPPGDYVATFSRLFGQPPRLSLRKEA